MDANAVHGWFGLSYAAYLVLPRSVMQSMSAEWQAKVVALLEEAGERRGHLYADNEYNVTLVVNGAPVPDPLANYRHVRL